MDFDGETFKVSLLFVFQSVATSIAWSITPWGYYATWALEKEGIIISSVPYKRRNDDRCGLVVSFRLPSTNKLRLNWRNTKRRPKCTACIISIMQRRSAEEIFVTKKKKSRFLLWVLKLALEFSAGSAWSSGRAYLARMAERTWRCVRTCIVRFPDWVTTRCLPFHLNCSATDFWWRKRLSRPTTSSFFLSAGLIDTSLLYSSSSVVNICSTTTRRDR